ncbi:MAG: hypothetical protein ACM33B_12405 [Pseudomonadota bacterium]
MSDRHIRPVPPLDRTATPLRCLECGTEAEGSAPGWRALIGGGYEGEPLEVGVYCPRCAAREFDAP